MKKAILCIGIDAFDKGDITPLSGAAEDARRWAAFFEMRLGFKAELLTHEKLRKGVRILDVVDELLKHAGQPGDLFGLFIATHGKQMRLADGQMDQLFLLPHARLASIEAGSPGEGALSLRQLALETARPGLQRFFIIDACRAPLSAAGSRDAAQPFGAEGQVVYRDLLLRRTPHGQGDSPLLVLNACADQQRAAELRGRGRGVFSLAAEEVATDWFENGKRLNLDAEFVAQVGVRMRELTRDQDDLPTQDPVIDQGSPLCLWDPNDRQQQQWRTLKVTFERQLHGGALDAPAGQCARDTLAALLAAGLPAAEHQTLAQRLTEHLEAAQKAHTQAQQQAADARLLEAAQEFDTEAAWLAVWSGAHNPDLKQRAYQRLTSNPGPNSTLTPEAPSPLPVPATAVHSQPSPTVAKPTSLPTEPPREQRPTTDARVPLATTTANTVRQLNSQPAPKGKSGAWLGGLALGAFTLSVLILSIVNKEKAKTKTPAPQPAPQTAVITPMAHKAWPVLEKDGISATRMADLQRAAAVQHGLPVVFKDSLKQGGYAPDMVVIPGGQFTIGSPEEERKWYVAAGAQQEWADWEKPKAGVKVGAFALGRREVTKGEFAVFAKATGRAMEGGCRHFEGQWKQDPQRNWQAPGFDQPDEHPVVCVNWEDAQAYAAWLSGQTGQSYRLPNEAEWEWAARAGTTTMRWWGDDTNNSEICAYENVADRALADKLNTTWVVNCKDGYVYTAPVGRFQANALGVYDMLGNAAEWVQDCFEASHDGQAVDGKARQSCKDMSRRVVRGGSWSDVPGVVRSAFRNWVAPVNRIYFIGFRLARTF